ncbi:MAG: ATP-binding protein [Labilithrix sp.]|nr:ATP-binding protein [Labilithrix sp.]
MYLGDTSPSAFVRRGLGSELGARRAASHLFPTRAARRMNADKSSTAFELSVWPDPTIIASVRRFVAELCGRVLADGDITARVVVATHELLDNAVRYATRDASRIRVELHHLDRDVGVVIATKNRIDEDRGRELRRRLDEMRASSDRGAYYRALLRRAAEGVEGAGLGLGRVHAEAGLDVSGRFDDDSVLIRAEGRFVPTRGPALR